MAVSVCKQRTLHMLASVLSEGNIVLAEMHTYMIWMMYRHTHTHTHTRLMALCPGLPGWASTRKEKPDWILLKQETVSGSGISWAICNSAPRSRQIPHQHPTAQFFYRLDALPATQPTASKHWRQYGWWNRRLYPWETHICTPVLGLFDRVNFVSSSLYFLPLFQSVQVIRPFWSISIHPFYLRLAFHE